MYKILGADNKEYGPVSTDQVRQWIAERRLNAQSLVQAEGTTGWKPLSIFPEFSSTLAGAVPPPSLSSATPHARVEPSGTNGLALASLICGGVGLLAFFCCPAFSLVGLVLGIVALVQLKSRPMQQGKGLAIAGIVVSALGLLGYAVMLALGLALEGLGKMKNF